MLYEIIKVTRIDSVHEEKVNYYNLNASDEDIRTTIIPELNKLTEVINMNYKLIQSIKRVRFVIRPISNIDVINAILTIDADINVNIHNYNVNASISNRRSIAHNKNINNIVKYPIIKLIDRRDFNNPFVNYNIVYGDAETGEYVALGREQEIF